MDLLDIFAPWPRKWGSGGPTVVHALHKRLGWFAAGTSFSLQWLFFVAVVILQSDYASIHYRNGWCRIVVAVNGNAWTFSEEVIASIIYDSRCWMSDVAFRTTPPIGLPSCLISRKLLELATSKFTATNFFDRKWRHNRLPVCSLRLLLKMWASIGPTLHSSVWAHSNGAIEEYKRPIPFALSVCRVVYTG